MVNRKKLNVNREYAKWCKEIARTSNDAKIVSHFRDHVYKHLNHHKNEGKLGFLIWMAGVIGFLDIFKEKYQFSTADLLFKNCIHYKSHKKGPKPSFDIDKFMEEHRGVIRNYYFTPRELKKWKT